MRKRVKYGHNNNIKHIKTGERSQMAQTIHSFSLNKLLNSILKYSNQIDNMPIPNKEGDIYNFMAFCIMFLCHALTPFLQLQCGIFPSRLAQPCVNMQNLSPAPPRQMTLCQLQLSNSADMLYQAHIPHTNYEGPFGHYSTIQT